MDDESDEYVEGDGRKIRVQSRELCRPTNRQCLLCRYRQLLNGQTLLVVRFRFETLNVVVKF